MRSVPESAISRALTIVAVAAAALAGPVRGEGDWRHSPVWDDGQAEFCAYEVQWRRYDELFDGRALLILVKEPWAPGLEVKADQPRPDGFDVLKLNHIRDVPTGIYTYHQMASVFLRRDDGSLRKLAATSSEGCGISTAHLTGGILETRSYFDGQGEKTRPYPAAALPEDGLPAQLRDFLEGEAPASVTVYPSLMFGRFPDLAPATWRLSRRPAPEVVTPAGTFAGVELALEREGDRLSYVFDRRPPHPLLVHTRADGTSYRLAKCERIPYWRMNGPGGEGWLPAAVR